MKFNYMKSAAMALAFACCVSSCSDFLEEENKTGATAELEYATVSGIDGLMGSAYSFLRLWAGKPAALAMNGSGTDDLFYGIDCGMKPLGDYTFTAEQDGKTNFDSYWEAFYCGIDVCNLALKYVPLNTAIGEAKKQTYLGEAQFLRAFYYFLLVNTWGPVPYNATPFTEVYNTAVRMPEEFIYSKILEDLDNSIANLTVNDNDKESMRVSSVAAHALKARVLLYAASWMGENSIITNDVYKGKNLYALAQQEAQKVIDSNFAQFYDNTSDLWLMTNEDLKVNKEAIFGMHYTPNVTTFENQGPIQYSTGKVYNKQMDRDKGGNALHLVFVGLWNNSGSDLSDVFVRATKPNQQLQGVVINSYYSRYSRGFRNYLLTPYSWNLFCKVKDTDQRYEATIRDHYDIAPGLVSKNYPLMKDTAIYFINADANSPEGQVAIARGKNRYRVYTRTGGDLPLYTTNDPATAVPTTGIITPVSSVYNDDRYNSSQFAGDQLFVSIKKYEENCPGYSANSLITPSTSERDIMLIRLAEMYLIKAECQMELGQNGEALNTLNYLRAQRAISGKDNSISGTVTLETILDERCLEFLGEGDRWFDLKRTHTLIDRVKKYNKQASPNIKEYHYLRPIPSVQLQALDQVSVTPAPGSGFWQNEGY